MKHFAPDKMSPNGKDHFNHGPDSMTNRKEIESMIGGLLLFRQT